MPYELITIPCRSDNYAFLLRDHASGETLLVDVPAAAPILAILKEKAWSLTHILLTHHHDDHVAGLADVLAVHRAQVIGAAADQHRLPSLNRAVVAGDTLVIGSQRGRVMDVPGHTVGHIAVYFDAAKLLFSADSLMALGCGRLFEGTAEQMWQSLDAMRNLPADTLVCSGHEYTLANAKFAITIEPQNTDLIKRQADTIAANQQGKPTVPSRLSLERATNPFLRPESPEIRERLQMPGASNAKVFAEIRRLKDKF